MDITTDHQKKSSWVVADSVGESSVETNVLKFILGCLTLRSGFLSGAIVSLLKIEIHRIS